MNSNQVKGKTKEVLGEVQQKVGELIGSESQQLKGHAKEIEGKVQKTAGDAQQAVKDTAKEIDKSL